MASRPLTGNAADPRAVRYAARKERQREAAVLAWLKAVLSTYEGRAVWATYLEEAGLYESSFDHSGSVMYFREGKRNDGLKWQARLVAADEGLYELLERERRDRRRRLDTETAAVQTSTDDRPQA
jgi:hypothetical protein